MRKATIPQLLGPLMLMLLPLSVSAQSGEALSPRVGAVDFGVRATAVSGDAARFQRYRDLRDSPFIDSFRFTHEANAWQLGTAFEHVGARDQRYVGELERIGSLRLSFTWDQVQLFYSVDTRTPYTRQGADAFRLPDTLQSAIQAGEATVRTAADAGALFDLRSRRDSADLRLKYAVTPNTELRVGGSTTHRNGQQPWGAPFGFSLATEIPRPIDERTDAVNAALEWADGRSVLRVAYDGSLYTNAIQTLVWDNPVRLTDTTSSSAYIAGDGTSQGRMALAPNSTAHTVSLMGSTQLPARSRGHAYVSIGNWTQDEQLLPHTINTAIAPQPALSRSTAEAAARIVSANVGITSRPAPMIWLNARARLYDFDNRTPPFQQPVYVRMDQAPIASVLGASEPFEYVRHYLNLDASFTPVPGAAFGVGYGREHDDRTFRFVETTTEHALRLSVDSLGLPLVTIRALFEHAVRTGDGLDEEVFSDVGEQISLRQFDISDRTRNRLSTILHVLPTDTLGVSGSVGIGSDNRPDANFGLQDNDHYFYTVGFDYTPVDVASLGLSYGRERYDTLQRSRQANPGPQFDDSTRDWGTDMDEDVHTIGGSLALPEITARTAISVSYDYSRSEASYRYSLAANSTLDRPEQLSPVTYGLHRGQTDITYELTRQVSIGLSYWYDRFDVEDFAFEPRTLEPRGVPGSGLFLGYMYRPYRAHTGWLRLIYVW